MPRKKIPIDGTVVFQLSSVFCTTEEIASRFGCSKDTIEGRFMEQLVAGRDQAKRSIRAKQYQLAIAGNVGMLIWLGKQYLGQSDNFKISDDEGGGFSFIKERK